MFMNFENSEAFSKLDAGTSNEQDLNLAHMHYLGDSQDTTVNNSATSGLNPRNRY